jgi:hypothetical protein
MVVAFELNGQPFTALNGGPQFKFNEAISFQVHCETQERWAITGRSSRRAGMKGPSSAAGSRISTASHGRFFPPLCSR